MTQFEKMVLRALGILLRSQYRQTFDRRVELGLLTKAEAIELEQNLNIDANNWLADLDRELWKQPTKD